jgi:hypothetical protein
MPSKLASWPLGGSCREAALVPPKFFTKNAGPIQLALGRLDAPKQSALLHDLEQLWIDNNLATNGENRTLISNEYLEAVAMRR